MLVFLDGTRVCVCVRLSMHVHHVCAYDCVRLMDDGGVLLKGTDLVLFVAPFLLEPYCFYV